MALLDLIKKNVSAPQTANLVMSLSETIWAPAVVLSVPRKVGKSWGASLLLLIKNERTKLNRASFPRSARSLQWMETVWFLFFLLPFCLVCAHVAVGKQEQHPRTVPVSE